MGRIGLATCRASRGAAKRKGKTFQECADQAAVDPEGKGMSTQGGVLLSVCHQC